MLNESDLIRGCKEFNKTAQRELYLRYVSKMRGVCIKYVGNNEDAKDILQEGFIKVYNKIDTFSENGSLEGWIRRIMVNTAINHYRKNRQNFLQRESMDNKNDYVDKDIPQEFENDESNVSFDFVNYLDLSEEELLKCLKDLPESYRIVFNLFCFENYSHADIAKMLSIDERTSRTRLFRARKMLKGDLYKLSQKKMKNHQANIN